MFTPRRRLYSISKIACLFCLIASINTSQLSAQVQCVVLDEQNWDEYVPLGKEVDAIYGDIVLRNDKIVAVIANPVASRNANMTVKNVGGCVIDLTSRMEPNDQLSCFYPGADQVLFRGGAESIKIRMPNPAQPGDSGTTDETQLPCESGQFIEIEITGRTVQQSQLASVTYKLSKDADYVEIQSMVDNQSKSALITPPDMIRADNTFVNRITMNKQLISFYDQWFHQAYGILVDGDAAEITFNPEQEKRKLVWIYHASGDRANDDPETILPGHSRTWKRSLFPASDWLELELIAARIQQKVPAKTTIVVRDVVDFVPDAKVRILNDNKEIGFAQPIKLAGLKPAWNPAIINSLSRPTAGSQLNALSKYRPKAMSSWISRCRYSEP